jgi:hypothetical protein
LFNISGSADLDVERLAKQSRERRAVAGGRPQLELGVAAGAHLEERVFAPIVQFEP